MATFCVDCLGQLSHKRKKNCRRSFPKHLHTGTFPGQPPGQCDCHGLAQSLPMATGQQGRVSIDQKGKAFALCVGDSSRADAGELIFSHPHPKVIHLEEVVQDTCGGIRRNRECEHKMDWLPMPGVMQSTTKITDQL
ncbi:Titin-like [Branchiostoma belcheri]|nr:Titin-like [Branchiostoma belcheri]